MRTLGTAFKADPRGTISKVLCNALVLAAFGAVFWCVGTALLVPVAIVLAMVWIVGRVLSDAMRPMKTALSVLAAQVAWMILGMVIAGRIGLKAVDVVVVLGGIAWMMITPTRWAPVLMLLIYQALNTFAGTILLTYAMAGTPVFKAVLISLSFNVAAFATLLAGWRVVSRESTSVRQRLEMLKSRPRRAMIAARQS
jgi:hypothetical protein